MKTLRSGNGRRKYLVLVQCLCSRVRVKNPRTTERPVRYFSACDANRECDASREHTKLTNLWFNANGMHLCHSVETIDPIAVAEHTWGKTSRCSFIGEIE